MAVAIDSVNRSLSDTSLPPALSSHSLLAGVNAVEVSSLPPVWQQIANGELKVGHRDPDFLVALAHVSLTLCTCEEVQKRNRIIFSEAECSIFIQFLAHPSGVWLAYFTYALLL